MSRLYLRTARAHANRGERDALLDLSDAYAAAQQSGASLALAANTSTDPGYVRRLCNEHCARLLVLPIPAEELPPAA